MGIGSYGPVSGTNDRGHSTYGGVVLKVLGVVVLLTVVLGGIGAFVIYRMIRVDPIDADTPTAIARFTEVLNGNKAKEQEALRSLAGAIERDPEDAKAWLWYGLANMFIFIQKDETPYAIRTSYALTKAVQLDPAYKSSEGWRAFFEYMAAENRGKDPAEAIETLLAAGEADPDFTSFLVAIALAREPLSSGLPQKALGPLEAVGDCGDGTTYTCRLAMLHPHAPEGYHATLGDLKVRLGDLEGGLAEYKKALQMPSAGTWPYRSAFEEWVEGASKRAELLTNDNLEDDPAVFFASGQRACLSCHLADEPPSGEAFIPKT